MNQRLLLLLVCFYAGIGCYAQKDPTVDSFKAKLSRLTEPTARIEMYHNIVRMLMNTNQVEADRFGNDMTREAEKSRDRRLMVKAQLYNGERYSFLSRDKASLQKAIDYYNKGLNLARENKLDLELASANLYLAGVYMSVPDLDRSLKYTNDAFSIVSNLSNNDSLEVETYMSFGSVYQLKKEKLLSLRNFLNGLRIAEELKPANYFLLRTCYANLAGFYAGLKEYDKAIDFQQKAMDLLPLLGRANEKYTKVVDLFTIGSLYVAKKDYTMSIDYFEDAVKLADTLHYDPLKMLAYQGLLNQYLNANEPQKALDFFNARTDLKQFIVNFGESQSVDEAYASIYSSLGRFDSARYYFEKAAAVFESKGTPAARLRFYKHYTDYFTKSGNDAKAIEYLLKAKAIADQTSDLDWQSYVSLHLDSAYAKVGDFKNSYFYTGLYHGYEDSLRKLGEEKDLLQIELKDEEDRNTRRAKEEAEELERKHTVQYLGITIGIAIVFVLLVAMGLFRVSEGLIRTMGFFAFILLFEFITLLADNQIHHWTHGEPLQVLGIKIILIAMLLPLHHWLEHNVVHYLASRRLIKSSGKTFRDYLPWKKGKAQNTHEV